MRSWYGVQAPIGLIGLDRGRVPGGGTRRSTIGSSSSNFEDTCMILKMRLYFFSIVLVCHLSICQSGLYFRGLWAARSYISEAFDRDGEDLSVLVQWSLDASEQTPKFGY